MMKKNKPPKLLLSKLDKIIDHVVANNPTEVAQFRAGKTGLMGFFVGQVMKISKGSEDPKEAAAILKVYLNE